MDSIHTFLSESERIIKPLSLPYNEDQLAPVISQETVRYHFYKHHQNYAYTLNDIIDGTKYDGLSLIDIIKGSYRKDDKVFNNAAQVWNHNFYWNCLSPRWGNNEKPKEEFVEAAIEACMNHFGSGWFWIVRSDGDKFKMYTSNNAENPMIHGQKPIFCLDLWEHAYYIDYRHEKEKHLRKVMNTLVDWAEIAKK